MLASLADVRVQIGCAVSEVFRATTREAIDSEEMGEKGQEEVLTAWLHVSHRPTHASSAPNLSSGKIAVPPSIPALTKVALNSIPACSTFTAAGYLADFEASMLQLRMVKSHSYLAP